MADCTSVYLEFFVVSCNQVLDVLIQAVLAHLSNTRNINFSREAPSDGQQSTSLNPIASAGVCLSCLVSYFNLLLYTEKGVYYYSEVM